MSTNDPSVPIDVDLTRSTNGVWLVKMPKYLSKILDEHGDGPMSSEVGRLIRRPPTASSKGSTSAGGRTQEVVFRLNDDIMKKLREENPSKDYRPPPQEHQFCLSNISDGVLRTVSTRTLTNPNNPSSEQISFVGKVIQRAEVRPVQNDEYMALKRKQFEISQEPARKAQIIGKKTRTYVPIREHASSKEQNRLKKQMGKRVRSDEDTVLNAIFDAFAKNQYISMASLETITNQPKNYLQQLVKKYCNYNSAGHTYELKPQYRYYGPTKEEGGDGDDMDDDDDDDDDDFKDAVTNNNSNT